MVRLKNLSPRFMMSGRITVLQIQQISSQLYHLLTNYTHISYNNSGRDAMMMKEVKAMKSLAKKIFVGVAVTLIVSLLRSALNRQAS